MSNQTKINNLNYLIDPTFTNANNRLIDEKPFFEIPVKNKEEAYEAIIEISKNNDYTTGNLLDYEYFKDHHQLIAIYVSKQIALENPS